MYDSICVTGHRPNKLFGYDIHSEDYRKLFIEFKRCIYVTAEKLIDICYHMGITPHDDERPLVIYTGMALGVDQLFAEAAFAARDYYKGLGILDIEVVAVVPCKGQESKWRKENADLYNDILSKCDQVIVLADKYTKDCMQKRNEYMVDNSDLVFSVWDGTPGETANCTNYALEKNKTIIRIDPKTCYSSYYNLNEKYKIA